MYKVSKSVGVEYQVVYRGREYQVYGEEYNLVKGEGEAISPSLRYLGSLEKREGGGTSKSRF